MKLSVIIPVYNEIGTLAELLEQVKAVAVDKELILVDDGSSDGSRALLQAWQKEAWPDTKILFHAQNQGKGAAIPTGLSAATGDLVII